MMITLVMTIGAGLSGIQTTAVQETPPPPLKTIAVIGASASAGWGAMLPSTPTHRAAAINLGDVIECSMLTEETVHSWATASFFTNPDHFGTRQVDAAIGADASLVIALDYLFWYAYGAIAWTSTTPPTMDQRKAALDRGLDQLQRFDVPVFVGNLPNMSGAAGRILSEAQIPDEATLEVLNRTIESWAGDRDNVHIFDLSATVETLAAGVPFELEDHRYGDEDGPPLILPDQLHPTGEGLVAIVRGITATIAETMSEVTTSDVETGHDAIVACLLETHAPPRRTVPAVADTPSSGRDQNRVSL